MEKELEIPVWWKHGHWLTRRDCLPSDHPESEYMYVKNVLKKIPEDYGILTDTAKKYKDYTKEELLVVISQLENSYKF